MLFFRYFEDLFYQIQILDFYQIDLFIRLQLRRVKISKISKVDIHYIKAEKIFLLLWKLNVGVREEHILMQHFALKFSNFQALDNTFDRLREGLDEVLKLLLEEPTTDKDSNAMKAAKTLYRGCMNEGEFYTLKFEDTIHLNLIHPSNNTLKPFLSYHIFL